MPVRVVPVASCQREAFCLFQYILLDLSLDGIHLDQSRFLNGSRTAQWVSEVFEAQTVPFLGLFPNYTSLSQVSPVTLFTRQKLLFGGCEVDGFTEDSEQRASPSHWGDRWREGRCEMESFQHFLVNTNIFFQFLYFLLKPEKNLQFHVGLYSHFISELLTFLSHSKILQICSQQSFSVMTYWFLPAPTP